MIKDIISGKQQFNNREEISKSWVKTQIKKVYYILMAVLYCICGKFADKVAANSTWTLEHINQIWNQPAKAQLLYCPLC